MTSVKIYRPAKNAMQSGRAKTKRWVMIYESVKAQYTEPIMNWPASTSTLPEVKMTFATKEEAIEFAKKQNWSYTLVLPHDRKIPPKSYVSNFTRPKLNY